ncbi:MAG: serine/threonine-protein kinase [Pyrinomonadaceae bacterium]|nr:serine/threonine-protein kinase [Pyrinomonadaceae bacterium]MBP6213613.1 serine/threonine-protein kinase [Pyrinomonadaceae bacterium]
MTLTEGTKLGRYEIRTLIGVGGMGEVYRASDPKIGRDVAIKVLPADFSADKERVARFEQEAQAAGALNHPNIIAVYDVDTQDDVLYVVSELLEGEELRERLDQGSIPLRKVTEYAQQIVSGLSAAHEKGIVHRDLKPENLFITNDDRVKILDFGLAKLREPKPDAGSSEDATRKAITNPGVVMGTVGYMSPEQVRGHATDHRSDIFSFGLILYEMITGKRAFQHETMAETMSAILKEEPEEITESNPNISPALERIVRRCLEKKPERRFHSAHDLGFALESLSAPTSSSGTNMTTAVSPIGPENDRSPWPIRILAAAALLLLIGCVVLGVMYVRRPVPDERLVSFVVPPPEPASNVGSPAISPDGRTIAFNMVVDGKLHLYIRELGSFTERRLNGTDEAQAAFWSPDSRSIAFTANDKLKKVDVGGGAVQVICDAPKGFSGAWSRDGVIVFGSIDQGIRRVSASGGEVSELLPLDESRKETRHLFPRFLPDGRHFFYRSHNSSPTDPPEIFIASIDGKERKSLFKNSSDVYYIEPGYLLFARDTTVMAQPFDASKLQFTGDPVPVLENVAMLTSTGRSQFSVSENGTLVYKTGGGTVNQLRWFDRQGKEITKVGPPGEYSDVVLSPDGKRAAAERIDNSNRDIWMIDLERGLPTRFTFGALREDDPAWSPDGTYLVFSSNGYGDKQSIFRKLANGAGNDELLSDAVSVQTSGMDWSPDGKNILFANIGEKSGNDIWILPMAGEAKPYPLLKSEFNESQAHFSPDGRYFAYVSNESGREEVYIQSFPVGTGKWRVSTNGGWQPKWRRDGKELYYEAIDKKLMAVPVKLDGSVEIGSATALFQTEITVGSPNRYAVTADGQRFLINSPLQSGQESPFNVILNWTSTLKK